MANKREVTMQLNDIIGQLGGFQAMARELGVNEGQAQSGVSALLPAVLGGFKRQAQSNPAGVEGLGEMLGRLGGGGLLDNVLSHEPTDLGRGDAVLGQIFGSKDVSRTVAQSAAERSGLHPSLLQKMLPMVAMLAAGYMAKQRGMSGHGAASGTAPFGSAPFGAGPADGLAGMLGWHRDGNPLDDILRLAGRGMR
jgi:hypothetical protein